MPRRLTVIGVLAGLCAVGLPAANAARPCHPAGSRAHGPVVKWQGAFYLCAIEPRRLVPLSIPSGVTDVTNVVARGTYAAYVYYRDIGCDNQTVGARSVDRRTGALVFRLHSFGPCYDVYGWSITDVALRPTTGAFAVIRHKTDYEDGFDHDAVIKVDGPRATVLDSQDRLYGDERYNPDRILPRSLQYELGRVRWRRASGLHSAALG